jgi:3-hydroxybutyryl-CoA dehydrogenase
MIDVAGRPVAIVGAGLMGVAIGQVLAARGHTVMLHDKDLHALAEAHSRAREIFELLDQDAVAGVARIHTEPDLATAVRGARLVIEAASERPAVKRQIFRELEALAPADAILASNTSGIPIKTITADLKDASRVLGTHFWNPPYLVPLVEVVQAERTSAAVVEATLALLADAGLRPVHLRADIPGFVGNRLQHALKREAIALVAAGVCDAETVDTVVKYGFGLRLPVVGPLEQSDMIGLDLTLAIHETIIPALDVTPVPHPLLVDKVGRGERGMADGLGFRAWTEPQARELRARVTSFLLDAAKRRAAEDAAGSAERE